jgi:hypothetical protein
MKEFGCLLLLYLFCFPYCARAQEKWERESRIRASQVPVLASQFLDSIPDKSKLKWYREESLSDTSFEAKFTYQKRAYSVEFSKKGIIEDVEILMVWDELNESVRKSIEQIFQKNCTRFKVERLQVQYSGSNASLIRLFIDNQSGINLEKHYEIIVKCTQQKSVDLFEYLFDDKTLSYKASKIVFKNSSHLEY